MTAVLKFTPLGQAPPWQASAYDQFRLWHGFWQIEVNGAFTEAVKLFDYGEVGRVWVVGLQVRFVYKAHDDAVCVDAVVGAVVLSGGNGDDARDDLLQITNVVEQRREFFGGCCSFGLQEDNVGYHVNLHPSG